MSIETLSGTAVIIGMSSKGLRELIKRHPDFPIVQRGNLSQPWQIDVDAAKAWFAERGERERREREEKQRLLTEAFSTLRTKPRGRGRPRRADADGEMIRGIEARQRLNELVIKESMLLVASDCRQVLSWLAGWLDSALVEIAVKVPEMHRLSPEETATFKRLADDMRAGVASRVQRLVDDRLSGQRPAEDVAPQQGPSQVEEGTLF